jgi:Transposase DDE domain
VVGEAGLPLRLVVSPGQASDKTIAPALLAVDPALYRRRNLIERCFCKLKHFRRVATRFDKLARNFLSALALASARLWTRTSGSPRERHRTGMPR